MQGWSIAVYLFSAQSTVWTWIHRLGGPGLILLGLADNSAIPLPGSMDVFTMVLSAHRHEWWPYYAVMATLGAVIGGYLTYRLAEKGGEETLERRIGKQKAQRVYKKFERQGGVWVFLGSILPPPFPMLPILMAAGILEYPKKKFLAVLAAGRGLRYFALAWIGRSYGMAIVTGLARYREPVLYALIVLAILGAIAALSYFKWYRPSRKMRDDMREQQSQRPEGAGDRVA